MADAYNTPHLLNNYCCNECPIGKRITQPIDSERDELDVIIAFFTKLEQMDAEIKYLQKSIL